MNLKIVSDHILSNELRNQKRKTKLIKNRRKTKDTRRKITAFETHVLLFLQDQFNLHS
jgi:hypothetical protein